jgi:hypothetical protein
MMKRPPRAASSTSCEKRALASPTLSSWGSLLRRRAERLRSSGPGCWHSFTPPGQAELSRQGRDDFEFVRHRLPQQDRHSIREWRSAPFFGHSALVRFGRFCAQRSHCAVRQRRPHGEAMGHCKGNPHRQRSWIHRDFGCCCAWET